MVKEGNKGKIYNPESYLDLKETFKMQADQSFRAPVWTATLIFKSWCVQPDWEQRNLIKS